MTSTAGEAFDCDQHGPLRTLFMSGGLAAGMAFDAAMNRLVASTGSGSEELSLAREGIVALAAGQGTSSEIPALHYRMAWSGPDKQQRRISRAFGVRPALIGVGAPRLAIDGPAYRRRQKNRVKRRQR